MIEIWVVSWFEIASRQWLIVWTHFGFTQSRKVLQSRKECIIIVISFAPLYFNSLRLCEQFFQIRTLPKSGSTPF